MSAVVGVPLSMVSAAALAHHSAAAFDLTKTVDVVGTVKQFNWTNPHATVVLYTTDAAGKPAEAVFEANGPGYLARQGWKREIMHPGEKITIKANPMQDGGLGGNIVTVTLPDGRQLSAKVRPPLAPGEEPKVGGAGYEK